MADPIGKLGTALESFPIGEVHGASSAEYLLGTYY